MKSRRKEGKRIQTDTHTVVDMKIDFHTNYRTLFVGRKLIT